MAIVASVLLLIAGFVCIVLVGYWILAPLERAARDFSRPTQFTIADFLSLMFLIQLPMGAVHSLLAEVSAEDKSILFILDVAGCAICASMWALSVRKLSCAAITRPRDRLIFLALVLPIAYFGTWAFVIVAAAAGVESAHRPGGTRWGVSLWIIEGALIAAFWLSARFVRHMVAAKPALQRVDR